MGLVPKLDSIKCNDTKPVFKLELNKVVHILLFNSYKTIKELKMYKILAIISINKYLVTMYKSKTNYSVGHGNQLIHCSVIKWEFFE